MSKPRYTPLELDELLDDELLDDELLLELEGLLLEECWNA